MSLKGDSVEKTILTIDCGTQSSRAMIFSPDGELLAKSKVEYAPYFSEKPGWAEQDAQVYWGSVCKACQTLKQDHPHYFKSIAGVGVTTLRDCTVNVDVEGKPLRPSITWLDQRTAELVYVPKGPKMLMYKIVGMDQAISKAQKDGQCNWIMQQQPEIWERTHKYLMVGGFLNYRLTGMFKDSVASQQGHIPFNYKKRQWAKKGDLTELLFPVEKEKLPDLINPGEIIGRITREAALETGIPEGVKVVACGSDKGCETIGMGVLDEKMVSLSFGTTATVQTTTRKYYEAIRFLPSYTAPIPDHYNPEVEIFRGYWMITWFKNEFGRQEIQEAKQTGDSPEKLLNKLLGEVPPGSMGLICQPYWGQSVKNLASKGALIGFGDVHKRAHVYRAIIEGLGFALYGGLKRIERASKCKVEKAAVSGGASQSDQICQISADIFNLPMIRGKTYETSGLGAAIVASCGLGIHPSFEKAIGTMVKYDKVFEPNPDNVDTYRKLHKVYKKIYPSMRNIYKEIRQVVGYPE